MPPPIVQPRHKPLIESILYHLRHTVVALPTKAPEEDVLHALAHSLRQRLIDRLLQTEQRIHERGAKRLIYLSAEFLIGQSLRNNLFNLGLPGGSASGGGVGL
jgi:starch phosphorylase